MRKPLRTKKRSTPRNPACAPGTRKWNVEYRGNRDEADSVQRLIPLNMPLIGRSTPVVRFATLVLPGAVYLVRDRFAAGGVTLQGSRAASIQAGPDRRRQVAVD